MKSVFGDIVTVWQYSAYFVASLVSSILSWSKVPPALNEKWAILEVRLRLTQKSVLFDYNISNWACLAHLLIYKFVFLDETLWFSRYLFNFEQLWYVEICKVNKACCLISEVIHRHTYVAQVIFVMWCYVCRHLHTSVWSLFEIDNICSLLTGSNNSDF